MATTTQTRQHVAIIIIDDASQDFARAYRVCAEADGVNDEIEAAGWPLPTYYKGHASIRELVASGCQILSV